MKKENIKAETDTINKLREIRDKIGIEIHDLSFEQLKKYIENKITLHPTSIWQKQG